MSSDPTPATPVASLVDVTVRYGKSVALDRVTVDLPAGRLIGLIGPDGVGKSSLLALVAGTRAMQEGRLQVLGGDMASSRHRRNVCPDIAYMPQGLGRNLYPTLSVEENLQFFARLFGHDSAERRRRIDELTLDTGLHPFLARPAGKLSGGMKQKLGLCCALIHDPTMLVLDEPTTGVDPLARRQFWDLIDRIRGARAGMSVIVATAYMDEASRFDFLIAMDAGRVMATGTPNELYQRTGTNSLEAAFTSLMPEERRRGYRALLIPPLQAPEDAEIAIEAQDLTMRFGDFIAVDHVSFRIRRGEIFGFLGSNGCGKTTTMKMLTGLLPPTTGQALLFGQQIDPRDIGTRARVGYMSQGFSLYTELSVEQNLVLHARLFHVPESEVTERVGQTLDRFDLQHFRDRLPETLPLGMRQRLSLAVALVHHPELLILDEPTSGVDPIARDTFWQLLIDLSRKDRVTIFISTHFMNEGARCDRISLMHAGRVLTSDSPAEIVRKRGTASLEDAFIAHLQDADAHSVSTVERLPPNASVHSAGPSSQASKRTKSFSWRRALSYSQRESLELRRDPVRGTLALLGSVILMFVMGYGITLDVENLTFAVLDRDQTGLSQNYALNLSGSRYFIERPPITDYEDLDRRMRNGELALAIEIPPGFARNVQRGQAVQIGAWIDGAMPQRADTVGGYVQGMHQSWLLEKAVQVLGHAPASAIDIQTRFRYNPDVRSLPAIVPAVIPLLLLLIPAMLTALSVVREKELGSIVNFYATPVTRAEFLLGKQAPYLVLGVLNFFLLTLLAVSVFGVPVKGNLGTLTLASSIFIAFATGFGLLCSTFTRTQIAAMFVTLLFSLLPAIQFSGLINPVSSLDGMGALIGKVYPATHLLTISRGVFSKALGFSDLRASFWPLIAAVPLTVGAAIALLKKQER